MTILMIIGQPILPTILYFNSIITSNFNCNPLDYRVGGACISNNRIYYKLLVEGKGAISPADVI